MEKCDLCGCEINETENKNICERCGTVYCDCCGSGYVCTDCYLLEQEEQEED